MRRTLLVLLPLALVACGQVSRTPTAQSPGDTRTATSAASGQAITVDAGPEDRFRQTSLVAAPGPVTITLVVSGPDAHDLVFADGPKAGTSEVHEGSTSVTLTFRQPGTYRFLCTVHPQMQGTLTIR